MGQSVPKSLSANKNSTCPQALKSLKVLEISIELPRELLKSRSPERSRLAQAPQALTANLDDLTIVNRFFNEAPHNRSFLEKLENS